MLHTALDLYDRSPTGSGAVLSLLLVGISYVILRLLMPKPIPGIPYNVEAADSIWGDLPAFRAAPNRREWWSGQAIKHQSPLVQAFMRPFTRPWVFVADYYEAADICKSRFKEFDRSDATRAQFQGTVPNHHITLKSSHPQFKRSKELVRDLMSSSFLHEVSGPQIHVKFMNLIKLWERKLSVSGGRPFDGSDDIHNAALDIIMAASFGLDDNQSQLTKQNASLKSAPSPAGAEDEFNFEDVPLSNELSFFTALTDSVTVAMRSPAPMIHHFLYRKLSPTMRKAAAGRDSLRNREIAKSVERKKSGHPERCALDNMLVREDAIAEKEGREPNYYSQIIMSELLGYLVAGHDTTSSALRWGVKYLTADQNIQTTLRQAITSAHTLAVSENRVPTVAEIVKAPIPYLDAVLEEILRHARTLPVSLRQATADTQILGVHIPKGTIVGFLGNGPSVMTPPLPIPDEKRTEAGRRYLKRAPPFENDTIGDFAPERWLKTQASENGGTETVYDPNNGPSLAFGLGPRGCFGKKLAYLEMRIFFTLVLWKFEILPLKPELATDEESISMTRAPKHVYVRLQKTGY